MYHCNSNITGIIVAKKIAISKLVDERRRNSQQNFNSKHPNHQIVVEVGPYPAEASFYPEHFIIPLITLSIFAVVLYVIARIKKRQVEEPIPDHSNPKLENQRRLRDKQVAEKYLKQRSIGLPTKIAIERYLARIVDDLKKPEQGQKRAQEAQKKAQESLSGSVLSLSDFKAGEVIAIASLIATLVTTLVAPFGQLPVLDYTVNGLSSDGDEQRFEVSLHNYGTVVAKNVIVSFHANGMKFEDFSSFPFLADQAIHNKTAHKDEEGKSLLEIKELPPRSHTVLYVTFSRVPNEESNEKLITHVRSDETTGYHQTSNLIIFYVILVAWYILFALLFSTGTIYPLHEEVEWVSDKGAVSPDKPEVKQITRKINHRRIIAVWILTASGITSANMLLYIPYIDTDDFLYQFYYLASPLPIPMTILVLALVFYFLTPKDNQIEKANYIFFSVLAALAVGGLLTLTLLLNLPETETNNIFYLLSIWVAIVIVPLILMTISFLIGAYLLAILFAYGVIVLGVVIYVIPHLFTD